MKSRISTLKATVFALPIGFAAATAHAAGIVETLEQSGQFNTLTKAIESAGLAEQLKGEGPYTIFAPTDQAFMELPQGATDKLMSEENQEQLKNVLAQHVVEGEEIAIQDVMGQQTQVSTLQGDQLTVDGTSQVLLIVPTGLSIARVGDQLLVQRQAAAVTAPAVEVRTGEAQGGTQEQGAQAGQQQQAGGTSQGQQQAGASQGQQQQAGATAQGQEQASGATAGQMTNPEYQASMAVAERTDKMQAEQAGDPQRTEQSSGQPASEASPEDIKNPEYQASVAVAQRAEKVQAEGAGDPQTSQQGEQQAQQGQQQPQHQSQQQQAAAQGGGDAQQQGQAGKARYEPQADRGDQIQREATVVQPGIQADNGVIHAIDAVLVPQSVVASLQGGEQQQQGSQQGTQQQGGAQQQ